MFKHVLFDLDGTLTDPFEGITRSVQHALRRSGIEPPCQTELLPFIGPPLGDSFARFYGMDKAGCASAVGYYREHFSTKGLFENQLVEGVPAMLESLTRAGIRVYIATSKPTEFALQILKHFGILQYFTHVEGSPMDEKGCEKPLIVRSLLQKYTLRPEQAIMVGDRVYDINGGRENGIATAGVLFVPYADRRELEEAGAGFIAETPEQLTAYLLG